MVELCLTECRCVGNNRRPSSAFFAACSVILSFLMLSANPASSLTPCNFPLHNDRRACSVHDDTYLPDAFFCDPTSAFSMSEMQLVDENLQRIYAAHRDTCVCTNSVRVRYTAGAVGRKMPFQDRQCWYKFGFAFLQKIPSVHHAYLREEFSYRQCYTVNQTSQIPSPSTRSKSSQGSGSDDSRSVGSDDSLDEIVDYSNVFARVIRERWAFGECGEDILVFVILHQPGQMSGTHRPVIFVSTGDLVIDKVNTGVLTKIVDGVNGQLANGLPLSKALISVVNKMEEALIRAEFVQPVHKDHIPFWAWMVFATCGALCVLMTIGMCWIRTSTRRGSQRGKPNTDPQRRWKAGFVGDDSAPTTNVNLVQMMFPHNRQAANY